MAYVFALGHYKRTGKDTLANRLVQELAKHGLTAVKRNFAWKLKDVAHQLYGWAGLREPEFYDSPEGEGLREVRLEHVGLSPREIWIKLGTDAIRNNVYERTWLDYLLKTQIDADVLIIPDVRFPNEFDAVHALGDGGYLCKVVRPGYFPHPDNEPDSKLIFETRWNAVVGGSGYMDELYEVAFQFARQIKETGKAFPIIGGDAPGAELATLTDRFGVGWREAFARYA